MNDVLQSKFNFIEVEHIPRIGSDHAPLLLSCETREIRFIKSFRFLNFWTKHKGFKEVVRLNWDDAISVNPFWDFKRKIKKVEHALSSWSKDTFGDIFHNSLLKRK